MIKKLSLKRLSLLCAIGFASSAFALPTQYEEWVYYSDSSYSNTVGYKEVTCRGKVTKNGIQTAYRRGYTMPCFGDF